MTPPSVQEQLRTRASELEALGESMPAKSGRRNTVRRSVEIMRSAAACMDADVKALQEAEE